MQKRARNKWGGRRDGAGRPPAGAIASERHETRPQITARDAIRIIARVVPTSLDASRTREAVARAIDLAHARGDFWIHDVAVHGRAHATRLELVVSARSKIALARGMQGFQVSAARGINRAARRSGTVFPDRYRMRRL